MIRSYRQGDDRHIAEIFCRAIHEIGIKAYTEEQCLAWSPREPDYPRWEKRCALKRPLIFEQDGQIAGFLELDPDGLIDCAYISPDFQRRGIMAQLVRHAIGVASRMGLNRVYVEASILARPLFEKLGFTVLRDKTVRLRGVELLNFDMEQRLD